MPPRRVSAAELLNNGQHGNAILIVENSVISGNQSPQAGGGIANNELDSGGATVTVTDSTISDNGTLAFGIHNPAPQGPGAGIYNFSGRNGATLTVTNSTISGNKNSGFSGGGIYNKAIDPGHATATVTNSTISGNSTYDHFVDGNYNGAGSGGGICNVSATLTIDNSTVSGNLATDGGGIDNFSNRSSNSAMLTVTNSAISDNLAWTGGGTGGGGIRNIARNFGSAILTLTNSTLSGNDAGGPSVTFPEFMNVIGSGGGIQNKGFDNGSVTAAVTNSTISGNFASISRALPEMPLLFSGGAGQAIYNDGNSGSAMLTITNSTLSDNLPSPPLLRFPSGGTIHNDSATLIIRGTILNGIITPTDGHIENVSGSVTTSHGYNLSNDGGGGYLTATGDQINTGPMLGPLQDNGGPTLTHALLTGSSAIDAGKNFSGSTTDQRGSGFARTFEDPTIADATGGDGTDIGAFEVHVAYAAQIQQPINADGTSVFNVRRGVVPVKFTLTLNGVATCNLPPATIVVYRTGQEATSQSMSLFTRAPPTRLKLQDYRLSIYLQSECQCARTGHLSGGHRDQRSSCT